MNNNVIIKRINDWLECYQNKDNGYYNATALLKQYNEHYPDNPKKMIEFLRNKNTQNYIGCVVDDEKLKKSKERIITFDKNQQVAGESLYYFKKGRALKGGGRTNDTYYFAPMLFSKFGTWLSPELERDIHKVLWNNILEYRNEIRQLNPYFTDAIKDFSDSPNFYCKVNAMIQKAVLGKYQPNGKPLDKANENELFRYKQLQNEIVTLIKFNIIKDYEGLKIHIRGYYD